MTVSPSSLLTCLKQVTEQRSTLSRSEARELLGSLLSPRAIPATPARSSIFNPFDLQLSALLGALAARGETPEEIAGFVDAMRSAVVTLPLTEEERLSLTDTCGTGGDLSGTFNISTAAALVAAAAGAKVAKHGNRAVTSQCGSADVLEALGIPIQLSPQQAAETLRRHNFCFLLAPNLHPAMKAVLPIRRALGVRTVFNVLGPLANPAQASAQVMGVYSTHLVPLVAEAMLLLGVRHGFVVHGSADGEVHGSADAEMQASVDAGREAAEAANDRISFAGQPAVAGRIAASVRFAVAGLDELSISGSSSYAQVRDGVIVYGELSPESLGLERRPLSALAGGDASTNAAILLAVFAGEQGPRRDIVLLNAAAVLMTAELAADLHQGLALARRAIDSGAVTALIAALSGIAAARG